MILMFPIWPLVILPIPSLVIPLVVPGTIVVEAPCSIVVRAIGCGTIGYIVEIVKVFVIVGGTEQSNGGIMEVARMRCQRQRYGTFP